MKGNSTTPSYGVHLHTTFNSSWRRNRIRQFTTGTVGIDGEMEFNGAFCKAMVYGRNIGKIKITDFGDKRVFCCIVPSY
jgi:hypothetical protein